MAVLERISYSMKYLMVIMGDQITEWFTEYLFLKISDKYIKKDFNSLETPEDIENALSEEVLKVIEEQFEDYLGEQTIDDRNYSYDIDEEDFDSEEEYEQALYEREENLRNELSYKVKELSESEFYEYCGSDYIFVIE